MIDEPKNPKDMTDEERMALPDYDEYLAATARNRYGQTRGYADDDIVMFTGTDDHVYGPVFYDGVWYKLRLDLA